MPTDPTEKKSKYFNAAELLAARPANLHKGAAAGGETSEALDIEKMIEDSGCSRVYYALEECLGEHDRDWTKCQRIVKELKQCNDKQRSTAGQR